ncbi:helix-turn-helix domain-containing protein [Gorillibacterium massiliense]|uniref:helix-turn-helix domain-containing protein n=1 Tax=Gorillibacterium massiliense TaxID=1280390 RepID=UPI0004B9BC69|nr:helix-turn-helix transcriptional regulator [Gorillibacterium massiliense]
MISTEKIGKRIAMLRKEKKLSQEQLAERLQVSSQAVSKWETGKSLPETAILPQLSKALGQSLDSILMPQELVVLSALYTDGQDFHDVTLFINSFVVGSRLTIPVSEHTLPFTINSNRNKALLVKYETPSGIYWDYAMNGETLKLDAESVSHTGTIGELEILYAAYGNEQNHRDVRKKLRNIISYHWDSFTANHELFPSLIDNEGPDHLFLIYQNSEGLHAVSCLEGERMIVCPDRTRLTRCEEDNGSCIVEGVERLGFGMGMDCSWGGAMVLSLKTMGIETCYETLMGVSGACWRIAFTPAWDYSSVDALVAYDYAAPAFTAYGIHPHWADRIGPKERKLEKEQVMASIRKGRLPVAINLRVAPEWGVITGYLNNGGTLVCRSYFDEETFENLKDDAEFQTDMAQTKGYLYVDQWPFAMVRFGEQGSPLPARDGYLRSLQVKLDSMSKTENRGYKLGYPALESWRNDLLDEEWYLKAKEPRFAHRLSVNHFMMTALTDARRCAATYLRDSLPLWEGSAAHQAATELTEVYSDMHGRLARFYANMPDDASAKTAPSAKLAWTGDQRRTQGELLAEVIRLEHRGDELARRVLESLR